MLKLKNCYVTVNKHNLNEIPIKILSTKSHLQFSLRFQSTSPATASKTETPEETLAQKEWQNAKPYEAIPSIGSLTLLKNFLPGGKYSKLDTAQLMLAIRRDLGNIGKLPAMFGRPESVMTHNVEDFEKVLRNEGIWPNRPGSEVLQYHRQVHRGDFFQGINGLISTQDKQWGTFRSAVNNVMMQPKNVRLYLNKMSQVNKEFIERIREIRDPKTLEVPDTFEEELNRWTLESVAVVALDKQLGLITTNRDDPMTKQMFKALNDIFKYSADIDMKPSLWKYYKTPTFKKLINAFDVMADITSAYVNEAIKRLEEDRRNGVPEKPESEQSVLEKLSKINEKIAIVMAMDMLTVGVDTTTSTFASILLCLAKNPEKQQKLREEIMNILPKKDSDFDEEAFKNMPYLRACIKEALRVYPLVIGNARLPAKDVVLSGYRVPKGTQVFMVSLALMQDEKHFPRAQEYLPERWLRSSKANENSSECPQSLKASNPFLYLPFGFGARSCIGRRIAEMELEVGVARMVRNYKIEFNHSTENAFKCLLFNVPNIPLKFKFTDVDC